MEASELAKKGGEVLQDLRDRRGHLTDELDVMRKSKDTQTYACRRGERLHAFVKNRISVYHKREEIQREREKIRRLEESLGKELEQEESEGEEGEGAEDERRKRRPREDPSQRVRRLRGDWEKAKEKKARLEGSLHTRKERLKEIQRELSTSAVYKNVEEKYQSGELHACITQKKCRRAEEKEREEKKKTKPRRLHKARQSFHTSVLRKF